MISKILGFSLLLAASTVALDPLVIDTPAVARQCEPTLVTWQGGKPSYQLSVVSGGHLIGLFLDLDETQFLWPTNVSKGTAVALQVGDSLGNTAQTPSFVIQPGSDC
ncbi:hypothetical protein BC628DRAFT_1341437 [Trametes gibbosa]|nr:hypothetical protein BC628DRAFT_1341437 [Trametes gibbosa]